ncbi:hypothetical protein AB6A23_11080 [Paenibacillus tarimensis]
MGNLIDKAKLLECLKKEAEFCIKEKFNEKKTRFYLGRETVLTDVIRQIESGTFDAPIGNEQSTEKASGEMVFSLQYCGIKEEEVIDCAGLTRSEIEKDLVQWVLERVDHWSEDVEKREEPNE